ncbi:MAG TPA: hypothetical protein V6D29_17660 [Leptolyngbyaceae cyanobacterium]
MPSHSFQFTSVDSAIRPYGQRTPSDYINQIEPEIRAGLNNQQLQEFERILYHALPKPSPKIVDLRFGIDLILTRFFIVVMVGQDRRRQTRHYPITPLTQIGNVIAAVVLLVSLNLILSLTLFLSAYLVKSALGINLFPGHLWSIFR